MWLDSVGEMTMCPVLIPFLPLQLFGQPKEHLLAVRAQLVWESLEASSFYEILVSLWVSWVALCWLPRVSWFVNWPHLAEKQLDPLTGVG